VEPKSFVESAVVLLVATAFAVTIFRRFGLGSVLGLLVAGILIGPHTPGFVVTHEPFAKLFCCILKIETLPDFMLRKRVRTRFF